jgi:hypothetical protein
MVIRSLCKLSAGLSHRGRGTVDFFAVRLLLAEMNVCWSTLVVAFAQCWRNIVALRVSRVEVKFSH